MYECRCDESLQSKTKEFTRLVYTGSKLVTRLTDENFDSVMGECVIVTLKVRRLYRLMLSSEEKKSSFRPLKTK